MKYLRVLSVLMLALLAVLTQAQSADLLTEVTVQSNVRFGPGVEWRVMGEAAPGTPFRADGQAFEGDWVRGITADGVMGWIIVENLAISKDEAAGLRQIWVEEPFTLSAPGAGEAPADAESEEAVETEAEPEAEATTAPAPQNVPNAAPVRGFEYGGHIRSYSQATFDAMNTAGMTWIKKQVRYTRGQDPSTVASTINQAKGSGYKILLGVVGDGDAVNEGGYFEDYAGFVGGLAELGADAIEVWNEPNINREWADGSIDPAQYTEMLKLSYAAIKAANPETLVVSGAPAPTGFFGGCGGSGCDDNLFVQGMAAAGAANYMDCVGIHYNEGIVPPTATSGDPRGNSTHYTRYYPTMVSTYHSAFGGRKPLCFTELGYLTPDGYGNLPAGFDWAQNVTVDQQAAWLDQVINLAATSGRVRLVIIWNVDFTNYDADPMAGYAMIRPGGGCPACEALSQ